MSLPKDAGLENLKEQLNITKEKITELEERIVNLEKSAMVNDFISFFNQLPDGGHLIICLLIMSITAISIVTICHLFLS